MISVRVASLLSSACRHTQELCAASAGVFACFCLCAAPFDALGSTHADLSLGAVQEIPPTPQRANRSRALAHYATALQLESEGRVREALQHYRPALAADPGNADLAAHAAELVLKFESHAAAIKMLDDCIKANPGDANAHINLARFHATYPAPEPFKGDPALQVLADALAKLPGEAALYREAVMLHLIRGNRAEAAKVIEQAAKQPSRAPEFWIEIGRIAQQVWPLSHPEKKEVHRRHVNPFFERALKLAPPAREEIRLAVSQYYVLSNQLARAAEVTEEAVRINRSQEAKKLLVRLYQTLDREAEAITLLEEILKAAPSDVESRRLLVTIYERLENFEKAVPHAESLIQAGGGTAEDYMSLGILLLRSGRTDRALQLSQRTLALFPNNARFTFQAALAQRSLRRYDEALQLYQKTETLAQGTVPELLNDGFYQSWADTLQSAEKFDEAARKYQRSIDLTPEGEPSRAATVLNNLGYMWLQQQKNLDQAGEFIRKANELEPKNPIYLDSLGWFHYLKGNYQEALKVLLEVPGMMPKLGPDEAEIMDHIAQTYLKLGDKPAAVEYFKRALELKPDDVGIKQRYDEARK